MKKIISTTRSIAILTFLIVGCDNRPLKTVERVGLNDTAYYTFERNTDNVISVDAKKYMYSPFYSVSINKDTLLVGQDFKSYIGAYRKEYKIVIDSPTKEIIEGIHQEPEPGQPEIPREYIYKTEREGKFKFSGRIEMDTLVVPFEYTFMVTRE